MKCEDCGTEDPGAPSYKPACLIERDALRRKLEEVEAERERWAKWAVAAAEVEPLRARVAELEAALRECEEAIVYALGEAKLTPDEEAALSAGLSYDSTVLALKLTHALASARAALSPAPTPVEDDCPDCNDGILTRAFAEPHDIPCPTCKGTMRAPPPDTERHVCTVPLNGSCVCGKRDAPTPDAGKEGP